MRIKYIILGWYVVAMLVLVGCDAPPPSRAQWNNPATPTSVQDLNDRNVRNLCDFFHFRPHEVLLTPNGQANAKLYAMRSGVPTRLRDAVNEYYANDPKLPDDRAILDNRYAAVITRCMEAGWSG